MVDACGVEISGSGLLVHNSVLAGISAGVQRQIRARKRPELQERNDRGIDGDIACGENSLTCIGGGNRTYLGAAERLTQAFIVEEKECLVFDDWTANRATKLISTKRGKIGAIEEISRIERAVAQQFLEISVKEIGARPGDSIDDTTRSSAILGRVVGRQNGKFLD